nr:hypothetical protein [uncultured Desulfobacter sp.]
MNNGLCTSETFSKYFLGGLFGLFSLGLIVLGFTLLPVIGFVLALPVLAIGIFLIRTRLNDQCELDFNTDVS